MNAEKGGYRSHERTLVESSSTRIGSTIGTTVFALILSALTWLNAAKRPAMELPVTGGYWLPDVDQNHTRSDNEH